MENEQPRALLESILEQGRTHHINGDEAQAEQSYLQALDLARQIYGTEHLQIAKIFNLLVSVYSSDNKRHRQAKILCKQVMSMGMNGTLPANHDAVTTAMNNLAVLHIKHGAYRQAELLLKQVYAIRLEQKGSKHTLTRLALHNLCEFYHRSGKVEAALLLAGQALTEVLPKLQACPAPPSHDTPAQENNNSEGVQS